MENTSSVLHLQNITCGNSSLQTDGTTCKGHDLPPSRYIELVFGLFTLVGSGLILRAIHHFKVLHTSTNWYIASLCVSNSLSATAQIVRLGLEKRNTMTLWSCIILKCMLTSTRFVQTTSMLLLSWDRWLAVKDPDATRTSFLQKYVSSVISAKWSISILFPSAWGLVSMLQPNYHLKNCDVIDDRIPRVPLILGIAFLAAETMVMAYFTIQMLRGLKRGMAQIDDIQTGVVATITNDCQRLQRERRRVNRIRHTRLSITLSTVMLLYLLTWPFFLLMSTVSLLCSGGCVSLEVIQHWSSSATVLNCVTSVILYSYKLKYFRSSVGAIICCAPARVGVDPPGIDGISLRETRHESNEENLESNSMGRSTADVADSQQLGPWVSMSSIL